MLLSSLRQQILDRAIRGQLVPQLPEEGTAEELYQQIQAEKKALITNGTIKKEKPLEPIQEEDIPFEIPATWKWVRLGDCTNFGQTKQKARAIDISDDTWIADLEDIEKSSGRLLRRIISKERKIAGDKTIFKKGDILFSKLRPYLQKILIADESGVCTSELVPFTSYGAIEQKYLVYVLKSPSVDSAINISTYGMKMPRVGRDTMLNLLIPLPPQEEQTRIVRKIEALFSALDTVESSKKRISAIQTELTKRILNQAIQGKLVPQLPEEGTAEELYQQIQAEKKRLIAAGTIKKEKPLPPIEEKDLPFDIPETWKWVRLDDLVRKNIKRGKAPVYTEKSGVAGFSQKCNSKRDGINLSLARYLDEAKLTLYNTHDFLVPNDIVINSTGEGTLGRVGIFQETDNPNNIKIVPDGHVTIIRSATPVLPLYLYHYLKSRQSILEDACGGSTHQTELRPQFLRELLIPLPPLKEQKRIVAKIEELLTLCKSMQ